MFQLGTWHFRNRNAFPKYIIAQYAHRHSKTTSGAIFCHTLNSDRRSEIPEDQRRTPTSLRLQTAHNGQIDTLSIKLGKPRSARVGTISFENNSIHQRIFCEWNLRPGGGYPPPASPPLTFSSSFFSPASSSASRFFFSSCDSTKSGNVRED